MRLRSFLVPAIALVLLLAIASGAAPAASPEGGAIVTVKLDLQASNGLRAQLETSDEGMVTLELRRKDELVSYEVKGEVTESGLRIRFGRLGLIDAAFTPTGTLSSTEPPEGCTGEPRTLRDGIFTGTIEFTGERGYTRIAASQAAGSMSVVSQWQCPEEPTPFALAARSRFDGQKGEKSASLHATGRQCMCAFYAGVYYAKGRGRSIFYAAKAERREGIEIIRTSGARAGGSAFAFDHEAGTATLRPPPPFSGRATFIDRPGRDLWHSTIRIQLLGIAPLSIQGPGVRAALYPEYHFD
ncbi:MAG: hypothetical protein WA687_09520 [Solirubrobacterales bacterium]